MAQKILCIAACIGLLAGPVAAQEQSPSIDARLADATDPFERGAYKSLDAIEGLLQEMNRYAIGRGFNQFMGMNMRGLQARRPDPREPDTFRNIISAFAEDLEIARATLAGTTSERAVPFVLDVASVWFDVNGNGANDPGEDAVQILQAIMPRRRGIAIPDGAIEIRFDAADHAWLSAYTHVLSAAAEAILAFDPTPVFADLGSARSALADLPVIPNTYDAAEINARISRLSEELSDINAAWGNRREAQEELRERINNLQESLKSVEDEDQKEKLRAELETAQERQRELSTEVNALSSNRRFLRRQIRSAQMKLPVDQRDPTRMNMARIAEQAGDIPDTIYTLIEVLRQKPDAGRIANVERHLRAMLSHNRDFWDLVAQETDEDREWVPNASQTNAFGLTVNAETAKAWQFVLEDTEALLDGRLLILHPLLPMDAGINVAAWFDDPSALDPVGWVHGRDAYRYAAQGPKITRESWMGLQRQTLGNGFAFALFFN